MEFRSSQSEFNWCLNDLNSQGGAVQTPDLE